MVAAAINLIQPLDQTRIAGSSGAATPGNTQAIDYRCPRCDQPFQLKGKRSTIGAKIVDAAWEAMMRAIREDRTPSLFVLHYEPTAWLVRNAILVPHFVFTASAVEKRKPLAATARRAGWVGCNPESFRDAAEHSERREAESDETPRDHGGKSAW